MGYALLPIVVPAVMFLIAIFVGPETRTHSIWQEGATEASRSRAEGGSAHWRIQGHGVVTMVHGPSILV